MEMIIHTVYLMTVNNKEERKIVLYNYNII